MTHPSRRTFVAGAAALAVTAACETPVQAQPALLRAVAVAGDADAVVELFAAIECFGVPGADDAGVIDAFEGFSGVRAEAK